MTSKRQLDQNTKNELLTVLDGIIATETPDIVVLKFRLRVKSMAADKLQTLLGEQESLQALEKALSIVPANKTGSITYLTGLIDTIKTIQSGAGVEQGGRGGL